MIPHSDITSRALMEKIKREAICFGGNRKLKIYGTLKCSSGKRMRRENRVFFSSEVEANNQGYRPCGHCMKSEYMKWTYSVN